MKTILLDIFVVIALFGTSICLLLTKQQNADLKEKVAYYENVITDLGAEEFIYYPELYYEDGYINQVKVHNCMWAFDIPE